MGETIRTASLHRQTGETDIELTLNLDGTGKTDIDTGIGFFDHMLNNFARHGLFDLTVKAKGDLYVDCDHHIIECAFKSFAKSLDAATMVDERITSVLSTKGTL